MHSVEKQLKKLYEETKNVTLRTKYYPIWNNIYVNIGYVVDTRLLPYIIDTVRDHEIC